MFFVIWAKSLRIWQILLFLIPFLTPEILSLTVDNARRATLDWTTPSYANLSQTEGVLMGVYLRPHERGKGNYYWGQLKLDGGSVFRFTCNPGIGDAGCAYATGVKQDPNLGKRLKLHYFNSPSTQGPSHVVMAMTGPGRYSNDVALSYADSVQRIETYRADAKRPGVGTILYGGVLVLLLPGLLWRLIAGRDPDPPKGAKTKVELSEV